MSSDGPENGSFTIIYCICSFSFPASSGGDLQGEGQEEENVHRVRIILHEGAPRGGDHPLQVDDPDLPVTAQRLQY